MNVSKLFDVYNGQTKIACNVELDVALCLIKGYIESHDTCWHYMSIADTESSAKKLEVIPIYETE